MGFKELFKMVWKQVNKEYYVPGRVTVVCDSTGTYRDVMAAIHFCSSVLCRSATCTMRGIFQMVKYSPVEM